MRRAVQKHFNYIVYVLGGLTLVCAYLVWKYVFDVKEGLTASKVKIVSNASNASKSNVSNASKASKSNVSNASKASNASKLKKALIASKVRKAASKATKASKGSTATVAVPTTLAQLNKLTDADIAKMPEPTWYDGSMGNWEDLTGSTGVISRRYEILQPHFK